MATPGPCVISSVRTRFSQTNGVDHPVFRSGCTVRGVRQSSLPVRVSKAATKLSSWLSFRTNRRSLYSAAEAPVPQSRVVG